MTRADSFFCDSAASTTPVLVQSLLPFNSETSASEQSSVDADQLRLAFLALKAKKLENFDAERHQRMVRDAVALRQLARVKLADDADLDMAQQAVEEAATFFQLLRVYAKKMKKTPYEILRDLK